MSRFILNMSLLLVAYQTAEGKLGNRRIPRQTIRRIFRSEFDYHDNHGVDTDVLANYESYKLEYGNEERSDGGLIVCNSEQGLSGFERSQVVRRELGVVSEDNISAVNAKSNALRFLYNRDDMTCFLLHESSTNRHHLLEEFDHYPYFTYERLDDNPWLKIRPGLVDWYAPSNSDKEKIFDATTKEEVPPLHITMCPHFSDSKYISSRRLSASDIGIEVIHNIQHLFEQSTNKLYNDRHRRKLKEGLISPIFRSLLDMSKFKNESNKRSRFWHHAFKRGFFDDEDTNNCHNMLTDLFVWDIDSEVDDNFILDISHTSSSDYGCVLSLVATLASDSSICGIDSYGIFSIENDQAQWIMQSGQQESRPWFDVGLTGAGQVIGVSDTGLDTDNCYFYDSSAGEMKNGLVQQERRKVIQYVPHQDVSEYENGHGTHVAGIAVGHKSIDGVTETNGFVDGIAKDAKLSFFDLGLGEVCCTPPGPNNMLGRSRNANAKIHNASWGSNANEYTQFTANYDEYIYNNQDTLFIVSAGNAFIISDPATSKNGMGVGCSHSAGRDLYEGLIGVRYMAYFSGQGPTTDGRIKPDIVAPGHAILSAGAKPDEVGECDPDDESSLLRPGYLSNSFGITYKSGSSMSSPVIAGAAALIRQYFMEHWYPNGEKGDNIGFEPSATLIKAVLLNGAVEIDGIHNADSSITPSVAYDDMQGFGRVELLSSLPLKGYNNFQAEVVDYKTIFNGGVDSYEFDVGHCVLAEISATLVWMDPPGLPGCDACVLNDLDLVVTKNGQTYFPNGLASKDEKNNVERTRVFVSPGDSIVVEVKGTNLSSLDQTYALIVTGCFGSDNFNPSTPTPTKIPTKNPSVMTYPTISPSNLPIKESPPDITFSPSRKNQQTPVLNEIMTTFYATTKIDGIMFDIVAETDIYIHSFDLNFSYQSEEILEIYCKDDSYVGHEKKLIDWEWIALIPSFKTEGTGKGVSLPSNSFDPIYVPSGTRKAFYVTTTNTGNLLCSESFDPNSVTSLNSDLIIFTGSSVSYSFSNPVSLGCGFSGKIRYSLKESNFRLII